MALWVSSHIQETFKNKKGANLSLGLATAEVYISQVSENGFLPICRHRCQSFKLTVQSLYCKLCKGAKQRFFSSMPVLHLRVARMKPCWAVIIIIVYEFLALQSCRTASRHC